MPKISNLKKLEALKDFLTENNIPFIENHYSKLYGLDIPVKITGLRIAVFLSDGNKNVENAIYNKENRNKDEVLIPLFKTYKPFFIRTTDSKAFVIEKMQNCLRDRMLSMQKKWLKKQMKANNKNK